MMKLLIVFAHCIIGLSAQQHNVFTLKNKVSLVINNATEGYVVSPGFTNGTSYPNNFYGSVEFLPAQPNRFIKLYFEYMDLDAISYCAGDSLEVWETLVVSNVRVFTTCGSHRPRPWVSTGGRSAKIVFRTDSMLAGRGFRIRFQASTDNELCAIHEFPCKNRKCIPLLEMCDGVINCADGSDEKMCNSDAIMRSIAKVPCGTPVHRPVTESEDRVVGGQEAAPNSWPWQVSISSAEYEVMGHFCGGSIIAPQWVLTAAHCLTNRKAKDVLVTFGAHNLMNVSDVVTRRAEALLTHGSFSNFNKNVDLGLIKLDMPVNFTDKIRPICLPRKGDELIKHGHCFAAGWGQTRGTGSFGSLKQVEMIELPFQECRKTSPMLFRELVESDTFCAGDRRGEEGVCHGDSGGPLFCSKDGSAWSLQGVANSILKTTGLYTLCGVGSDSFWNRVSAHLPWIKHSMRAL
ncbi:chymotrypsinogen B-like isoform X2 [Amblyomma americanum]